MKRTLLLNDLIVKVVIYMDDLHQNYTKTLWRNPNFFVSVTKGKNTMGETVGTGYDFNKNLSILKSKGEFFERESALSPFTKVIKTSYEHLKSNKINIYDLIQYQEHIYINNDNFKYFSKNKETYWVEGLDYLSNQKIMLPYELVYLKNTDIKPYREHNSTGLAFHTDLKPAISNGFFEVIERNDFMAMWLYKDINYEYRLKEIYESIKFFKYIKVLRSLNLKIRVFNISKYKHIHTILILISNGKGIIIAAASSNDIEESIEKSLSEALASYFIYSQKVIKGVQMDNPFDRNVVEYLTGKKSAKWLENYKCESRVLESENKKHLTELIKLNNLNLYYKILENSSIGIVVRVIVPNTIPLSIKINNFNLPNIKNSKIHPFP